MDRAFAVAVMLPLIGCNIFGSDVSRGYKQDSAWNTAATYTTADVRIITQRVHPVLKTPVVCTEPSPEWPRRCRPLSSYRRRVATTPSTPGVGGGGGSAEAALELAGRSTALLGLRDGLFQTCQAFANGSIGADAYSLILSRYGQLMTTLFLAQDAAEAAGAGTNGGAATALTRMNEDYFHLDFNLAHLLVVACVNEKDPTRLHAPSTDNTTGVQDNPWLDKLCGETDGGGSVTGLAPLEQGAVALQNELPAINPTVAVTQTSPQQPQARKTSDAATAARIKAAQNALRAGGFDPGPTDGAVGPRTTAALKKYKTAKNLPVTGLLAPQTLNALKVQ
jgi:hypothetical protein